MHHYTQYPNDCIGANFRRLIGGFPTDFDHDVIAADRIPQF